MDNKWSHMLQCLNLSGLREDLAEVSLGVSDLLLLLEIDWFLFFLLFSLFFFGVFDFRLLRRVFDRVSPDKKFGVFAVFKVFDE